MTQVGRQRVSLAPGPRVRPRARAVGFRTGSLPTLPWGLVPAAPLPGLLARGSIFTGCYVVSVLPKECFGFMKGFQGEKTKGPPPCGKGKFLQEMLRIADWMADGSLGCQRREGASRRQGPDEWQPPWLWAHSTSASSLLPHWHPWAQPGSPHAIPCGPGHQQEGVGGLESRRHSPPPAARS